MAETTYEEASRCPKCSSPGKYLSESPGPHGSKLHTIACGNSRCTWYTTTYLVQVNSDGSIPEPTTNRDKNFPKLPERSDESVALQYQRLYDQTISGGETR